MGHNFRNNDPGAVQFGNFINYYTFQSAEERVSLLPKSVWASWDNKDIESQDPFYVLDVGCNSGNVTMLLYDFFAKEFPKRRIMVLGVDIDESLIRGAKNKNYLAKNIKFKTLDVMDPNGIRDIKNYMKIHNFTKFNVVFNLSITMWIHLNHNDDGLRKFLKELASLSKIFVVEPQPWSCYRKAVRRLGKAGESFPFYYGLRWRGSVENDIVKYVEENLAKRIIFTSDLTKWKRKIIILSD